MRDLEDELPDSSPRFVLLSYPLTLVRLSPFLYSLSPVLITTLPFHLNTFHPRLTQNFSPLPFQKPSGRLSVPYVLIYYLPETCSTSLRMSYAGAVELMRSTAEAGKVLEMSDAGELADIEKKLGGET